MITGFLATFLIKEPNQLSLEETANEDQENFITGA